MVFDNDKFYCSQNPKTQFRRELFKDIQTHNLEDKNDRFIYDKRFIRNTKKLDKIGKNIESKIQDTKNIQEKEKTNHLTPQDVKINNTIDPKNNSKHKEDKEKFEKKLSQFMAITKKIRKNVN